MNLNLKTIVLILIGLTGYGVWALMAYFDPALRHDFLTFNIMMASGTIGLVVRDMKAGDIDTQPTSTPPVQPPQPGISRQQAIDALTTMKQEPTT